MVLGEKVLGKVDLVVVGMVGLVVGVLVIKHQTMVGTHPTKVGLLPTKAKVKERTTVRRERSDGLLTKNSAKTLVAFLPLFGKVMKAKKLPEH